MTARPRLASSAGSRLSPDTWALVAIAGVVVLGNLPYLLGFFVANPLGPRSGLLTSLQPGIVSGMSTLDPNDGLMSQALGHLAVSDWSRLQIPWWNPYEGTGTPLTGGLQAAAMFPPTLLVALSNGQIFEHMLLEFIAGACTYLLLRRLLIHRLASSLAGISFALNGTFAWFAHATVNPVAMLPMLLLGLELARDASLAQRAGGWWLIAVAGALSLYAGFPEVTYIDSLLAGGWFVWRWAGAPRDRRRAFAVKVVLGTVTGVLLATPLLVAMLGYFPHADTGLHATGFFGTLHLPIRTLPQLFLPYLYGPLFGFADPVWGLGGGFLSTSLLLFAIVGVAFGRRRGLVTLLLIWLVLVGGRAYGIPGLGTVLGLVPGMDQVDFSRYTYAAIELPVAILAALGIDVAVAPTTERMARLRRPLGWCAVLALAMVGLGAVFGRLLAHDLGAAFNRTPYYWLSVLWGAGLVVVAAVSFVMTSARGRAVVIAGVMAVDAVTLFAFPMLAAPRAVQLDNSPVAFLRQHLGTARFATLGPLRADYGSYFRLSSLSVNDGLVPRDFARYVRTRLNPSADPVLYLGSVTQLYTPTSPEALLAKLPAYRAVGVAYVVVPRDEVFPKSPGGLTLVFRSPSAWIYHVPGAHPFFSVTGPGCQLQHQALDRLTVSCAHPATLIRQESYLPGWGAQVDGREQTVRRSGMFQAVSLTAGTHEVSFGYAPPNADWALVAFILGCIGLLLPAASGLRR